jgi:hypothetical protein
LLLLLLLLALNRNEDTRVALFLNWVYSISSQTRLAIVVFDHPLSLCLCPPSSSLLPPLLSSTPLHPSSPATPTPYLDSSPLREALLPAFNAPFTPSYRPCCPSLHHGLYAVQRVCLPNRSGIDPNSCPSLPLEPSSLSFKSFNTFCTYSHSRLSRPFAVISKLGVRYTGIFDHISQEDQTICLSQGECAPHSPNHVVMGQTGTLRHG